MTSKQLNNDHFTQNEIDLIDKGCALVLEGLSNKIRNLTPEERQKYGSIAEQNKLVVAKVLEYSQFQPHLNSPDVDYGELTLDYADRQIMASLISRLMEMVGIADNIRITHDFDSTKAARDDYDYAKYKMVRDNGAGWEKKYNDLLPFYKTYYGPATAPDAKKDDAPDSSKA